MSVERLEAAAGREREGRAAAIHGPPWFLGRLPVAFAQEAIGLKTLAFLVFFARSGERLAQDAIGGKVPENKGEFGRSGKRAWKAETDSLPAPG